MDLALSSACSDSCPRQRVTKILRSDAVQMLHCARHTQLQNVQQQSSSVPQPVVHIARTVQLWVVDVTLPTDRRAWFGKVCSHHEYQFGFVFLLHLDQKMCILYC